MTFPSLPVPITASRVATDPSPGRPTLPRLRTAYAALNGGNPGPMLALLDAQAHLCGPERGHLWWTSHRTWNGATEVSAELARRAPQAERSPLQADLSASPLGAWENDGGATPAPPQRDGRPAVRSGEPITQFDRFIVEYVSDERRASAPTATRRAGNSKVSFYEVVTIRDGVICRLTDYRSRKHALAAASAAF